jgi:hypothetical protein
VSPTPHVSKVEYSLLVKVTVASKLYGCFAAVEALGKILVVAVNEYSTSIPS